MKPPGSSSRRLPLAGCSLAGASRGPCCGPIGPVPVRAPARAPPCLLLLVLLLLPALASSSRPRAWGAPAPSGGYGPVPFALLSPRGPVGESEGHAGPCALDMSQVWPFRASLSTSPPFSFLTPWFILVHFWKSIYVAFTKNPSQLLWYHWEVFSGSWVLQRSHATCEGETSGWEMQQGSKLLLVCWSLNMNAGSMQ